MRRAARRRRGEHAPSVRGPRAVVCAVITVSDTRRGREDTSGAAITRLLVRAGHTVATRAWVRDEPAAVRRALRQVLDRPEIDVVITTGGTGLTPRDRTPEAVTPFVDRWLPGFGELFRMLSMREVGAAAWMSRATAGVARGRLLFVLPGSRAAVTLATRKLIVPELVHALRALGRFNTSG